jgi:hypothetical protein
MRRSGQSDKEASQTRVCWVAKNPSARSACPEQAATFRTARPDSSRRKERLFGMTIHPAPLAAALVVAEMCVGGKLRTLAYPQAPSYR